MGPLRGGHVDREGDPAYVATLSNEPVGRCHRPRWSGALWCLLLTIGVLTVSPPGTAAAAPPPFTGVSVRQSSLTTVSDASIDHALHPELRLVSPMVPWRALEPQDDVFDFTQLDLNVQDAAANGYRLMVRIMSGRMVPDWLLASTQALRVLGTDPNASDYCDWIDVVTPWNPTLEAEYREMMATVGAWLAQDDGLGGTKADHVYLVPISMPTLLGSEMQIGFGNNVTCPTGTDGAGTSLSGTNSARWHTLGTNAELQSLTEAAWHDAIAIHLEELPANVRSVIAYGALFGDGQAAALRIARSEVGPSRARLWSMYTNLQPAVTSGEISGVWKDWCPACDDVIMAALRDGGTVGFQVAGTDRMDTHEEFTTAIDDAIPRYTPRFVEASPAALDRELEYLLTGPNPVQDRLAAIAAQVLSTTSVSCDTVEIGSPSTCTATVSELWDDPSLAATGEVSFAADAAVAPTTCTLEGSGSCAVGVTPSGPGPIAVSVSYVGDEAHLPSAGAGSVATFARASTVRLSCTNPVLAGQGATCTATVADSGSGDVSTPTGIVTWRVTGSGGLGASQCTLVGGGGSASCDVVFTPSAAGTSTVTADYAGTTVHQAGTASVDVVADPRSSSTSVACAPTSLAVGSPTTCTATASDASGAGASGPTGTVSWTSVGLGSFGVTTCTLAGGGMSRSCWVTYTPIDGGSHAIRAAYGGDAAHLGSEGSVSITATLPDVTAPTVQITWPTNGGTVTKARTVTITATASDDRGVARVEFRVNGALKCTDTTAAYTCAWAVPKQVNVTYTITATAFDAAGNTRTATITVKSR